MRKKKLLAMPALEATDEMIRLAKSDRGKKKKLFSWTARKYLVYDRDLYVRAVIEEGILKAAVFSRESLRKGNRVPDFEVYISTEEEKDLTWIPETGKWSEASAEKQLRGGYYYRDRECWDEEGARQQVCSYLGRDERAAFYAIQSWQRDQRIRKIRGRHQQEKARIDEAMEKVPELPGDWTNWVYHSAFSKAMYMMYHYGDKENRAYCTACGQEVHLKRRVKHQESIGCPNCHRKVMAMAWNRQKTIEDYKKPAILQERKDRQGYVLRVFESKIRRVKEGDWRVDTSRSYIYEKYRFFLNKSVNFEQSYEWTYFKNRTDQELRWCNAVGHGWYGQVTDESILYHKNLKKLRQGTVFQYIPLEKLYSHNQGVYGYPMRQMKAVLSKPGFEYLIKLKLYRLVWDLTDRGTFDTGIIDWKAKKPWRALKIDKQQLDMCIRMDISMRELQTLQVANEYGLRLTRQQVEWYTRELGAVLARDLFVRGHVEKTKRYLENLRKQGMRIGDYMDYIEDLKALRIHVEEDLMFPKDFRAAHERYSEQRQEKEEELKKATIRKKDMILQQLLPDLKDLYQGTKADDYLMVLPECKEDFNREGRENHNCVGGTYYDKMLEGKCTILFLRRKEEPDKAFCTVEMDGDRVIQCRAVRNSPPPEEVTEFMTRYSKEIGRRIQKRQQEERKAQRVKVAI